MALQLLLGLALGLGLGRLQLGRPGLWWWMEAAPAGLPDDVVLPSKLQAIPALPLYSPALTFFLSSPCIPAVFPPGLPRRSSLSHYERTTVEGQLSEFDIALGACERISRQAIPMADTR